MEKENIRAFIAKKRDIFFVQLSLDIKREEMARLKEQTEQVLCVSCSGGRLDTLRDSLAALSHREPLSGNCAARGGTGEGGGGPERECGQV